MLRFPWVSQGAGAIVDSIGALGDGQLSHSAKRQAARNGEGRGAEFPCIGARRGCTLLFKHLSSKQVRKRRLATRPSPEAAVNDLEHIAHATHRASVYRNPALGRAVHEKGVRVEDVSMNAGVKLGAYIAIGFHLMTAIMIGILYIFGLLGLIVDKLFHSAPK